jgi:hypothetical protein
MKDAGQVGRQGRDVEEIALEQMNIMSFEKLEASGVPDKGEDLSILGQKEFDEMASDETRAAGDQDFHGGRIIV